MVERAHITAVAAGWLRDRKQPGEEMGLGVDRRADGWHVVLRSGDVAVSASCGQDPDDATVLAVLAGLLPDARRQAEVGRDVLAHRPGRGRQAR